MKINCSKKQRGVVVVLVAVVLPVLLLAMGWALDFGHVFVNKTRLQNALDATALSAAIEINKDITKNTAAATSKGRDTFNFFKNASGNTELSSLDEEALVFEYSKTLNPFESGTTPPAFVRVTSINMLNVTPILIRVIDEFSGDIAVPSTATAGPVGNMCDLAPLVICPPTTGGQIGCDETGCNGIPFHTKVCLKGGTDAKNQATCQDPSLPNGNFGLLRFDGFAGGDDIRSLLAGTVDTCAYTASWENGNKVGPVSQGIADRFAADMVQTEYTGEYPVYSQYDTDTQQAKLDQAEGIAYKRMVAVPVVDSCDTATPNVVAASCFFMAEKATHKGTVNEIIGELTSVCPGPGAFSPSHAVLFGPYKIVLFKSQGSGDS